MQATLLDLNGEPIALVEAYEADKRAISLSERIMDKLCQWIIGE